MVRFLRGSTEVNDPLLRPLFNDMADCENLLEHAASAQVQFARRNYVRATFAFLEGHLHWLTRHVQHWLLAKGWEDQNILITKLTLLDDKTFKPDKTGNMVGEQNRIPFLNWCAFVLRTAAECRDIDAASFFGHSGWDALQRSLKIRHRLTHPKQPEELEVSEAEVDTVREGLTWFVNCIFEILDIDPRPSERDSDG